MKIRLMSIALLAMMIAAGMVGLSGRSASADENPCEYAIDPIVAPGNGVTKGTSSSDVIVAYTDNNVIYAGAGNDLICSFGYNNTVYGGSGADEIYFIGELTDGTAYGESGNDFIYLENSNKFADGGSGNDAISFSNVNEIRGGSGIDRIWGSGANAVYANDGNDRININTVGLLDCGTGRDYWGDYDIDVVKNCERFDVPS